MAHIAIISASVGAGHDGAAAELDRRLTDLGYDVDRHDFCTMLPARIGSGIRRWYEQGLRSAPWSWHATSTALDQTAPAWLVARSTRIADQRVLAAIRPDTVAVVSTYPMACLALGRLRRNGRIAVPAISYLTDPGVHRTWVARGVDHHLAPYPSTAAAARRLGAAGVQLVAPAVSPRFRPARDAAEVAAARRAFRLPPTGKLVLIATGSLGSGRPERTAAEVAASGLATPVVACGKHLTLHQRLSGIPGVISLGWVDDMPTLMRAVDMVIHNAGGLTNLEALATGLPVITYRSIPGHGRVNSRALADFGLAPWPRSVPELHEALADPPASALPTGCEPAAAISAAARTLLPAGLSRVPVARRRHAPLG